MRSVLIVILLMAMALPATVADEGKTRGSGPAVDDNAHVVDGRLLFWADDGVHGDELWVTDGTRRGTKLVRDVGAKGSWPPLLIGSFDDSILFLADDGTHGYELWRSDGTRRGTRLVKDIKRGARSGLNRGLARSTIGDRVFFTADDGIHGRELWVSDGTRRGTRLVKDIRRGADGSRIEGFGVLEAHGRVFFWAHDGIHGRELWVSDGTRAGTAMVRDLLPAPIDSRVRLRGVRNGRLLFDVEDGTDGYARWSSDGTPAGTQRIGDVTLRIGDMFQGEGRCTLTTASGEVQLFSRAPADPPSRGVIVWELWRTDGTEEGTVRVTDRWPDFRGCERLDDHGYELGWDGVAYLSDYDQADEVTRLWRTDGTEAGTFPLRDFPGSLGTSLPTLGQIVDDTVVFRADDGIAGEELWATDGTVEGTRLVKDIHPDGSSEITLITTVDGLVYLMADDGVHGHQLWATDGTPDGTSQVSDVEAPGFKRYSARYVATVDDTVYFVADDRIHGTELWKTDGTTAGTRMVKDISKRPRK